MSASGAKPARFVAFEGVDASGKSTQARRAAERLGALLTREPGGTPLGETLRSLVLEPQHSVDLRAEALMIAAARAQHVAEVIAPTLASGQHVVTDRYVASSLVYQGLGSGLGVEAIRDINRFAMSGVEPDLTVLIDVPTEVAQQRLGASKDRFESEAVDFHERVRQGYLDLAAAASGWVVIDGAQALEDVSAAVDAAVAERL